MENNFLIIKNGLYIIEFNVVYDNKFDRIFLEFYDEDFNILLCERPYMFTLEDSYFINDAENWIKKYIKKKYLLPFLCGYKINIISKINYLEKLQLILDSDGN